MTRTLEQQAAADLAAAKATSDALMAPIFNALGVPDAKALARKPVQPKLCRAQGCTNEAHVTDFCRECDDRTFGGSDES